MNSSKDPTVIKFIFVIYLQLSIKQINIEQ